MKLFIQDLSNQTDLLKFAKALPDKESYMLLDGQRYQTGSDYSKKELAQPLNSLIDLADGRLSAYHLESCNGCSLCEV